MTPEELKSQGPPTTLDNTLRSMYRGCPRKMYWFSRGYDYKGEGKPVYFTWGSAWHEMLNHWYKYLTKIKQEDYDNDENLVKMCYNVGKKYWEENLGPIETFKPNDLETLEKLWSLYTEHYPSEPWILVAGEVGWRFPIGTITGADYIERDVWYGGSMDGYLEWPGYGVLAIEHKSTGAWISEAYLAQWSYSPQITGTIWGLTQLQGKEIFGCLMNIANKMVPGPRSKRTTPLFSRKLEKRSPNQLKEFEAEVLHDFKLINAEWEDWVWPKTVDPGECVGRVGRAPCLFRHICITPIPFEEIDPLTFQGIKLRKGIWEPWKRRGEQT
ncbi:hypothetical protein LCGC14_2057570 [marine sediment metagenome]|uniref:PD-(D/E)XK endonuclease-like domain-containing protein n=1 Tax=marine sediment metagenome TaxID=412755 RepID=A0A0F9H0L8_9ZZZZ